MSAIDDLIKAVIAKDKAMAINAISKKVSANDLNEKGNTPLCVAVSSGIFYMVKLFVEEFKDTDVNAKDGAKNPPLFYAISIEHPTARTEIIKCLIMAGAEITTPLLTHNNYTLWKLLATTYTSEFPIWRSILLDNKVHSPGTYVFNKLIDTFVNHADKLEPYFFPILRHCYHSSLPTQPNQSFIFEDFINILLTEEINFPKPFKSMFNKTFNDTKSYANYLMKQWEKERSTFKMEAKPQTSSSSNNQPAPLISTPAQLQKNVKDNFPNSAMNITQSLKSSQPSKENKISSNTKTVAEILSPLGKKPMKSSNNKPLNPSFIWVPHRDSTFKTPGAKKRYADVLAQKLPKKQENSNEQGQSASKKARLK